MRVTISALGPDNRNLVNPIISYVTAAGANICEIQMYDGDAENVFAMLVRLDWPGEANSLVELRTALLVIGQARGLSIRVWSRGEGRPRLAICATNRLETPRALLKATQSGVLDATTNVVIGNRPASQALAEEFGVDWHYIGDKRGVPDNKRLLALFDEYAVDYIILARYMRILPATTCWAYAGGRIINLHHGLLPPFPGPRPYHDAHGHHMLTYGATCHFIVPELDAGDQIIHQDTFTVPPGTSLEEILEIGQGEHEPTCLVEGVRRVIDGEVELNFHRVVRRSGDDGR
ncbi:MAG: formyltetrahydrofolate deformylase [Proteobacteria bacterium]|nr:formyltetrahydrofolate deformylase [Pseudomonadota bacterium]